MGAFLQRDNRNRAVDASFCEKQNALRLDPSRRVHLNIKLILRIYSKLA
jgi:hypothetical protein